MPSALTTANAISTRLKLETFKPPSFDSMQNRLQLKILQDGGTVGDRQIGCLSRPSSSPCLRNGGADLFCPAQVAQYAAKTVITLVNYLVSWARRNVFSKNRRSSAPAQSRRSLLRVSRCVHSVRELHLMRPSSLVLCFRTADIQRTLAGGPFCDSATRL